MAQRLSTPGLAYAFMESTCVVAPAEADVAAIEGCEAVVADGDAWRVAWVPLPPLE